MDWKQILFNTNHEMSLPAIIGIAVVVIIFSNWQRWYNAKRSAEENRKNSMSNNPENPAWHAPKKKKRSKK